MAETVNGNSNGMSPEEEKEFQIREQVRIRMEAKLQEELNKIKEEGIITFDFVRGGTFTEHLFVFNMYILITMNSL